MLCLLLDLTLGLFAATVEQLGIARCILLFLIRLFRLASSHVVKIGVAIEEDVKSVVRAVENGKLLLLSRLLVRASGKVPDISLRRHHMVCIEGAPHLHP